MMRVNGDIMVRSVLLQGSFTTFVFWGAHFGDVTLATANQVLLQFLEITAYGLDGFAFAAELLVGQAVGARSAVSVRRASVVSCQVRLRRRRFGLFFWLAGPWIIDVMTTDPEVRRRRGFLICPGWRWRRSSASPAGCSTALRSAPRCRARCAMRCCFRSRSTCSRRPPRSCGGLGQSRALGVADGAEPRAGGDDGAALSEGRGGGWPGRALPRTGSGTPPSISAKMKSEEDEHRLGRAAERGTVAMQDERAFEEDGWAAIAATSVASSLSRVRPRSRKAASPVRTRPIAGRPRAFSAARISAPVGGSRRV